jgi:hypothetical protein
VLVIFKPRLQILYNRTQSSQPAAFKGKLMDDTAATFDRKDVPAAIKGKLMDDAAATFIFEVSGTGAGREI